MEQPFICIDTRKGRIRLNKRCYDELIEPQYIRILINPEKAQLGIMRAERMTPEASRLKKEDTQQGHADVYCPGLIRDLAVRYHLISGHSYRINAVACLDKQMLVFPLLQAAQRAFADNDTEDVHEDQIDYGRGIQTDRTATFPQ